jgi:hypothetical protein
MDIVQFYISLIAADAVDIDQLKYRARERGIPDARVETNRTGANISKGT